LNKYGKPIWQLVSEAANNIGKEVFTASDIIRKIHEANPGVPKYSISAYVIAMAPNHPTSPDYESTHRNHPYFFYLGNGKYRLLRSTDKLSASPPKPEPTQTNEKEFFLKEKHARIISWAVEHQDEMISGRKNYGWNDKTLAEAITERNQVSRDVVLSRIRNSGGLDIETMNQVMDWGGLRHIQLENAEALEITRQAFESLDKGELKDATLKLMSIKGVGIASASKLIGLFDQNQFAIYDSRVGTALRTLIVENQRLVKCPAGRTRPGDPCSDEQWAKDYEKLIWILEIIRNRLNEQGYPFSIADVEMALFMMGK
jgi:hypothetical protein